MSFPETVPFLGWSWNDLLFLVLGGSLLGTGLMVVIGRNIIRSGLWMILCFAILAAIYALLGTPLVAAAQVLVYIGAISVLILFAIMLTQTKGGPAALVFHHQARAAGLAAAVLGVLLALVVTSTAWPLAAEYAATSAKTVAQILFSDYVLAFEIVGVLLLAAVVGGVFLAKRDDAPGEQPE